MRPPPRIVPQHPPCVCIEEVEESLPVATNSINTSQILPESYLSNPCIHNHENGPWWHNSGIPPFIPLSSMLANFNKQNDSSSSIHSRSHSVDLPLCYNLDVDATEDLPGLDQMPPEIMERYRSGGGSRNGEKRCHSTDCRCRMFTPICVHKQADPNAPSGSRSPHAGIPSPKCGSPHTPCPSPVSCCDSKSDGGPSNPLWMSFRDRYVDEADDDDRSSDASQSLLREIRRLRKMNDEALSLLSAMQPASSSSCQSKAAGSSPPMTKLSPMSFGACQQRPRYLSYKDTSSSAPSWATDKTIDATALSPELDNLVTKLTENLAHELGAQIRSKVVAGVIDYLRQNPRRLDDTGTG